MSSRLVTLAPRRNEMNDEQAGPFFLGLIVNYLLWGIQITQSYYYYKSFRKTDRAWLKVAVGLLFVMDAFQSCSISEAAWRFLVDGWGDLEKVNHLGWGLYFLPPTDAFTASIVHLFYAHKIWTLLYAPYSYICTALVISLSCIQLIAGVGCSIYLFVKQITLSEFFLIKTWASVWLMVASVTDIVITVVMTWTLSKSRTGHKSTDDIISKLIRLTVETGLATSIVQIVGIVVYLIWPLKPFHGVSTFAAPKVYSNSMLALLNSRNPPDINDLCDSRECHPMSRIEINTFQAVVTTRGSMETLKTAGQSIKHHERRAASPVADNIDISVHNIYREDIAP